MNWLTALLLELLIAAKIRLDFGPSGVLALTLAVRRQNILI